MEIDKLAEISIICGQQLHMDIGPGLLESVYERLLFEQLRDCGLLVERQVSIPIRYRQIVVDNALRIDLLVESCLPIELKSTDYCLSGHSKQLRTYLRFMDLPLGLLMNFGAHKFNQGVRCLTNSYYRALD